MAAGTSSRFAPLSYERHKALTEVLGEVLIERQIRQLKEAGINDIYVITGYKAEQFDYLSSKYGIQTIFNPEYLTRNNNGSIWVAQEVLKNSYVCSADNYFTQNPFESDVIESYYAAQYAEGYTNEWCMTENADGYISTVKVGGEDSWYMLGHTFWSEDFSKRFISILKEVYDKSTTKEKLWEDILIEHLDSLKMKIKKYEPGTILEFDTLDELRAFDKSYISDTRSVIIKHIADDLGISEAEITRFQTVKGENAEAIGFVFECNLGNYRYIYDTKKLEKRG